MGTENKEGGVSPERKGWEYTFLSQTRGIKGSVTAALEAVLSGENAPYAGAMQWEPDLTEKVQELGKDNWDLHMVVPYSSIAGAQGAGFTTDLLWVFKRPL